MVRKSVVAGFGVWLFAVVSVAGIAWIAIDKAGRQVTNVSATVPSPSIAGAQLPVIDAGDTGGIDVSPTPGPAISSVVPSPDPRNTTPAASRNSPRAYFASFSTNGGRVRAGCVNQAATLDGGYARPEPGYLVRVLSEDSKVWVVFGSQSQAIAVVARCEAGRPAFRQHTEPLNGDPVPDPGETLQAEITTPPTGFPQGFLPPSATTVPPTTPAASPSIPPGAQFGAQSSPQSSLQPAVSSQVTPTAAPATGEQEPSAQTGSSSDPARVAAYLTALETRCAQESSDWCQRWNRLTPLERYTLISDWIDRASDTSVATGGENGGRDGADRDRRHGH